MKIAAVVKFVVALAIGPSNVDASPFRGGSSSNSTSTSLQSAAAVTCNKQAIDECAASTGQSSTNCFKGLCFDVVQAQRVNKRQDQCTEANLYQCAINDWEDAELCFEQFCLDE